MFSMYKSSIEFCTQAYSQGALTCRMTVQAMLIDLSTIYWYALYNRDLVS